MAIYKKRQEIPPVGSRIGSRVVLEIFKRDQKTWYKVICDCGNIYEIVAARLYRHPASTCRKCNKIIHGQAKSSGESPTFVTWMSAIDRCENVNNPQYKDYGGRGIKICFRWRMSFIEFLNDMGERPKDKSLDRKNNNESYSCGKCLECIENSWNTNCKWSTSKEQGRNKRNNKLITYNNETKCVSEWAEIKGMKTMTLYARIYIYKWDIEKAFTFPVSKENGRYISSNKQTIS